ncbi:hypothetical protein ACIPYS_09375 [Kitasatospora sp. NPDC089913]|uniref:hypothetical protein n=1 Tax=Kitasatospora sp. NPDC089913 TaxID=3364080 RepID=UPI003802EAA2
MITRFLLTMAGDRRVLDLSIRCWVAVVDGLSRPWLRAVASACSVLAGVLAIVRFGWFRATADETLRALSAPGAVNADPQQVMRMAELMNVLWLASGAVLLVFGLMVAVAGSGSVTLVVGGVLWWTPLAMIGQRMPAADGLHTVGAVFIALSVVSTLLTPAHNAARGRRRQRPSGPGAGDEQTD